MNRARAWLVVVSACVLAAPAHAFAKDVVVRRGAVLYSKPSRAASVRLTTRRVVPLTLVRRTGGWLEVRTQPTMDACPSYNGGAEEALRMFVRASDIRKVTARRVLQRFGDGSSVTIRERFVDTSLAPPLLARVAKRGGLSATFAQRSSPPPLTVNARIGWAAIMTIGKHRVRLPARTWIRVRKLVGKRALIEVRLWCSVLVGWVDRASFDYKTRYGSGVGHMCDYYYVRAKTPLFWPDGNKAGTTVRDEELGCRGKKQTQTGRVCSTIDLLDWAPAPRLCFDAKYRRYSADDAPPPPAP